MTTLFISDLHLDASRPAHHAAVPRIPRRRSVAGAMRCTSSAIFSRRGSATTRPTRSATRSPTALARLHARGVAVFLHPRQPRFPARRCVRAARAHDAAARSERRRDRRRARAADAWRHAVHGRCCRIRHFARRRTSRSGSARSSRDRSRNDRSSPSRRARRASATRARSATRSRTSIPARCCARCASTTCVA